VSVTAAALERRIAALTTVLALPRSFLSVRDVATRSGLDVDPWQRGVLESDARQMILLASRQSGKSTTTAVLATHEAVTVPGGLILLVSPSLRQSQELYRKIRDTYRALGPDAPAVVEESALRLELANGARIIALPGKEATLRGFSAPTLVIEDESSRVPDDLYQALRPMLATSGGRLVLLSTPWGKRGHFYEAWERGGPSWQRVKVTAPECPRIPAAFLAEERRQIPDLVFRSEYLCEFVETVDSVFRHDDILAALDPDVTPLFGVPA